MDPVETGLLAGWIGIAGGVLSGVWMGLSFHRSSWLGGYGAFRRRLVRLGHIAFFGVGFLNVSFALTVRALALSSPILHFVSVGLVIAAIAMPAACFLAAWRRGFRHLFAAPVTAIVVAVAALFVAWSTS